MRLLARPLEWLGQRRLPGDDGLRIVRKGDRGEHQLDVDPIEELARIVGAADAREPRPHKRPTGARRTTSAARSHRGPR